MYIYDQRLHHSAHIGFGLGAQENLGGRMLILGQMTRDGAPVSDKPRVRVLGNLRDVEGHPIRTHPRWPDALAGEGGLYAVKFEFDATSIPGNVTIQVHGQGRREHPVNIRVSPIALPIDSAKAVFDALSAPKAVIKRFQKTVGYILKALRPSLEHPLWGALVNFDVGTGTVTECVATACGPM